MSISDADGDDAYDDEPDDPEESQACPTCGEVIEDSARLRRHLAGRDASRPECARTDLETLAEHRRRNSSGLPSWADFSRGF